jgi:hypothetical protein
VLYVFVSRHVGFIVDVYVIITVVSMTISLYYSAVYKSPYWLQLKLEAQTCKAWYVVMAKQNKWQCEDCTFQNHTVMQYCEVRARITSLHPKFMQRDLLGECFDAWRSEVEGFVVVEKVKVYDLAGESEEVEEEVEEEVLEEVDGFVVVERVDGWRNARVVEWMDGGVVEGVPMEEWPDTDDGF